MIIFQTIMMIFIMLIMINIILTFFLWRSTKSAHLKILFIHWNFLLLSFLIHAMTQEAPLLLRSIIIVFPNFVVHFSLAWIYSSMLDFKLPLKKFIYINLFAFAVTLGLRQSELPVQWVYIPLVLAQAFIYFYTVYQAFLYHYKKMTYSLKIIGIVLLVYGLHLFTYTFFALDPLKFAVGFGIALAIHMAIAILLPAAIIEMITFENSRLKAQMEFTAKLSHNSRMAALGEMAGGLAHEINNPLASLFLLIELTKKTVLSKNYDRLPSLIEKSQATIQRMALIVKGLLSFSRQEKADFKEISVKELIDETLLFCSQKIKNHNIDFRITMPETEIKFFGEKTLLTQVLLNIINNAFDAAVEQQEKWIRLEIKDLGEKLEFSVEDSGRIQDKETLERMFEPFFTTKEIGKGTGLGLSISKGIIETHRGQIMVESKEHTRVFFTILKEMRVNDLYHVF